MSKTSSTAKRQETPFFSITAGNLLLLGAGLILVWGFQTMPLAGVNEGRRALTVVEMLRQHNWLIPTMNGHVYIDKPPLLYWLMALSAGICGTTAEWALRLPSVLAASGTCALLFASLRRYLGRDLAIAAVLVLATSIPFSQHAHLAEIEMLLTFFCVAANLFFLDYCHGRGRRYLHLSYLCLGLAFLTKGPVALVFFLPPGLVFILVEKSGRARRGLLSLSGWLTVLIVGGGWYLLIWFSTAGPLLRQVIEIDLFGKSIGGLPDSKPFYNYFINLIGIFAPWTLLPVIRWKRARRLLAEPTTIFFTLQALVPLIIMSLFASKHNKYILPLLPALAVCLAVFLLDFLQQLEPRYPERLKKYFLRGAGGLLAAHLLFFAVVEPRIYVHRSSAFAPLLAAIHAVADRAPLYCANELKFLQLAYYLGRPIPEMKESDVPQALAAGKPFLLLAESSAWPLLPDQGLRVLFEKTPFRNRKRAVRLLTNAGPEHFAAPAHKTTAASTLVCALGAELNENSGLQYTADGLWTFNDSGGRPELYRVDPGNGRIRQTLKITDAQNHDWEDISADEDYIYISDLGNNHNNRHDLKIYRIAKADIPLSGNGQLLAQPISISYEIRHLDLINRRLKNHNSEALACVGKELVLFSKNQGFTSIYRIPKSPGFHRAVNPFHLKLDGVISGADYNPDNGTLALIGRTDTPFICLLPHFNPDSPPDPCPRIITLPDLKGAQAEGITWQDDRTLLISTEKCNGFLGVYRVELPDRGLEAAGSAPRPS
ncbi:MAG TPA: glycosyltransferase family 39 protein [Proteobacteria bacterium]|mgnify:CR=1 FL=1|nr:glycosyltransferase family 39 protein [Pseudomonadota bacterium]